MSVLTVSLGLVDDCQRTMPILDESIRPSGVDFIATTGSPREIFRRVVQFAEFDVSEMSMSTHMILRSHHDERYVGIPVFPRRAFRHGFIFVNSDSGIDHPSQLEGRRVGVSEYQQTASMWIRGILQDEYGVRTEQIDWFEGGLDSPGQLERLPIPAPQSVRIRPLDAGETLSSMLCRGELEAVICTRRPQPFVEGDPRVQRLIPDFRSVEKEYFSRTGHFPIMHMMVLRRSLLNDHPWLAQTVYNAFTAAKRVSDDQLRRIAERSGGVPWLLDDLEELENVFEGQDPYPYGVARNRHTLDKMIDMSFEQGLTARKVGLEELFAEEVLEGTKIGFL